MEFTKDFIENEVSRIEDEFNKSTKTKTSELLKINELLISTKINPTKKNYEKLLKNFTLFIESLKEISNNKILLKNYEILMKFDVKYELLFQNTLKEITKEEELQNFKLAEEYNNKGIELLKKVNSLNILEKEGLLIECKKYLIKSIKLAENIKEYKDNLIIIEKKMEKIAKIYYRQAVNLLTNKNSGINEKIKAKDFLNKALKLDNNNNIYLSYISHIEYELSKITEIKNPENIKNITQPQVKYSEHYRNDYTLKNETPNTSITEPTNQDLLAIAIKSFNEAKFKKNEEKESLLINARNQINNIKSKDATIIDNVNFIEISKKIIIEINILASYFNKKGEEIIFSLDNYEKDKKIYLQLEAKKYFMKANFLNPFDDKITENLKKINNIINKKEDKIKEKDIIKKDILLPEINSFSNIKLLKKEKDKIVQKNNNISVMENIKIKKEFIQSRLFEMDLNPELKTKENFEKIAKAYKGLIELENKDEYWKELGLIYTEMSKLNTIDISQQLYYEEQAKECFENINYIDENSEINKNTKDILSNITEDTNIVKKSEENKEKANDNSYVLSKNVLNMLKQLKDTKNKENLLNNAMNKINECIKLNPKEDYILIKNKITDELLKISNKKTSELPKENISPIQNNITKNITENYILPKINTSVTEKSYETTIRVGHEKLRKELLNKYKQCFICGIDIENLLVASHIKPWKKSNDDEKLDYDNVLLLCNKHDSLFDKGFIAFNEDKIIISSHINEKNKNILNLSEKDKLNIELTESMKKYLKWHFENIFKQ